MRIPNILSILDIIIFIGTAFLLPIPEIGLRILAGIIAMVVGFILFALRVFGLVFSILILFGIGLIMSLRIAPGAQESRWVFQSVWQRFYIHFLFLHYNYRGL